MSSLKQWREVLTLQADTAMADGRQYYHSEMMSVLEAGETECDAAHADAVELRGALAELRKAGREFLDASNAAAREIKDARELATVMQRWQNAGHVLRTLTTSKLLVRQ